MKDELQDSEEWQEAKAQLDQKDLLMRQTFALEAIEQHLRAIRASESNAEGEQQEAYMCEGCGDTIPENKLESHARSCMNWTEAFGDVEEMYSQ